MPNRLEVLTEGESTSKEKGSLLLQAIKASAVRQHVAQEAVRLLEVIDKFNAPHFHNLPSRILSDEDRMLGPRFAERESLNLRKSVAKEGLIGRRLTVKHATLELPNGHPYKLAWQFDYAKFRGEPALVTPPKPLELDVQPGFVVRGDLSLVTLQSKGTIHLDNCVAGYEGYEQPYGQAMVRDLFKLDPQADIRMNAFLHSRVYLEFND